MSAYRPPTEVSRAAAAGEEPAGPGHVLGEPRAVGHVPLQQGRPAPLRQQEAHHQRGHDGGGGGSGRLADEEEQAPPDAEVAEVVRVPGPGPQAPVHDLPLVGGVGLEPGELVVPDPLEGQPDRPQDRTRPSPPDQGPGQVLRGLHRQRDQPDQCALEQVDLAQGVELGVAGGLGEHLLVAWVLPVAAPAPPDVDGEPQAPDHRQHGHHQAPRAVALTGREAVRDEGDGGEPDAPGDVDDAVDALPEGDGEGDQHDGECGAGRARESARERGPGEATHRCASYQSRRVGSIAALPVLSGRTHRIWSTPMRRSSNARAPPTR